MPPKPKKKRDLDEVYHDKEEQEPIKKQATLSFANSGDGSSETKNWGKASLDEFPDGKARLFSWNINGLNAVTEKGLLQDFIDKFAPDVLCLQETKSDLQKISQKGIWKEFAENYDQYWNCCLTQKGYSGVGVLTKVKPISVKFGIDVSNHD